MTRAMRQARMWYQIEAYNTQWQDTCLRTEADEFHVLLCDGDPPDFLACWTFITESEAVAFADTLVAHHCENDERVNTRWEWWELS